jgi:hypothetical protein
MIGRGPLVIVALAVGVAAASLIPGLAQSVRKAVGLASGQSAAQVRPEAARLPAA